MAEAEEVTSFADLKLRQELCDACTNDLKFEKPTAIQQMAIPPALEGRDVIGLAETGSGKTVAFGLPILNSLLNTKGNPSFFALILVPARELAFQIRETLDALGKGIGLKVCVVTGGIDMASQAIALSKKPHIVVATPGRIVDHLENTKGFSLRSLKFLVMDEADRILNMDFEKEVDQILKVIPKERQTLLFSATMTSKVAKLQRASLRQPVKVEVGSKYQTVEKLLQRYIFVPQKYKDCYLVHILNEMQGNSFMVFCDTCSNTQRVTLMLRDLGFDAVCLHGQMSQPKRLGALANFQAKKSTILVATDVASRGLDIPHVDCVVNFDIPMHSKDYIHRVGRTARAGRSGVSITFVTQYTVELFQRIETLIGKKMDLHPCEEAEVLQLLPRVSEAQRNATMELKNVGESGSSKGGRGDSARGGVSAESVNGPHAVFRLLVRKLQQWSSSR
eukprot:m.130625 g.130625  ORF g.130625 m.130625 type:complete len:449 (-) comp16438_c0_seq8:1359-2705(-)